MAINLEHQYEVLAMTGDYRFFFRLDANHAHADLLSRLSSSIAEKSRAKGQ
jgi:hypothetical protein